MRRPGAGSALLEDPVRAAEIMAAVAENSSLPVSAKIPKVEVFADVKDMGRSKSDWKKCNIETKVCAVGDVRIVRFHRVEHRETDEPWQELSVDMMNENPTQTRAVKLYVTYQPQSGAYLEACLDDPECGWHKRLPASQ